MKHIVFLLLPLLFTAVSVFGADFCLFKDGKPMADIVTPRTDVQFFKSFLFRGKGESLPFIQGDVKYFNDCVQRCTAARFKIVDAPQKGRNSIQFRLVEKAVENDDEFTITFPKSDTMLITATKRSAFYSLVYILEECFNCRFVFQTCWKEGIAPYGEDINHFPQAANVSIPVKTVRKTASFNLKRQVDWRNMYWGVWKGKNAVDSGHGVVLYAYPAFKYMKDQSWPKEILPVLKGKKYVPPKPPKNYPTSRLKAGNLYCYCWNPCYSHPKSARIAIDNILEYLATDPKIECISMGINDNGGMCECDLCRKAVGKKRTITGHADYSQPYWKWMNTIAEAVAKKYPDVKFGALAYREVLSAPDFKLHKNIIPQLCFEINAMIEPSTREKRLQLFASWKKAADSLTLWDYSYGMRDNYVFPRIYFKFHTKYLDLLYREYNLRGVFAECNSQLPMEGPKHYLMAKKLYDVNTDAEKTVEEWINITVGKKSAPYLRAYYQFWEDYWNGPEIRKTRWYSSHGSTYLPLGELPSHTYALKKGDMKKLRSLLEKTVANTETPVQKRRAQILLQYFELSEKAAQALFSESMPPTAKITDAAKALEIMKQIPDALSAYEQLQKHPFFKKQGIWVKIPAAQYSAIGQAMAYIKDPAVRKEAEKLADTPNVPMLLKGMLKVWLGTKAQNLIPNGSFEEQSPMPRVLWNEGGGYRTAKIALTGDYSFRMPPFCCYAYEIKVDPAKTYLFMFDAYIKKTSIEGVLNYQIAPKAGGTAVDQVSYLNNRLAPGKWTTFSGVCKHAKNSYGAKSCSMQLMIYLRKFEKDDEIYIDNIRAYCLDDLK